jgi:3-ketosteroid 9alpha-monooxygenase subunit A
MSVTAPEKYAYNIAGNYARGWHVMLFSTEIAVGEIKRFQHFEKEFIIYRGENGEVGALDAYCPHLGANLGGVGAKVIGNHVRCPFHGWQFDNNGACQHIPHASAIPPRAKNALGAWPIIEKCGFIAVWHDYDGMGPDYALPDIPDWDSGAWGEWRFKRSRIGTQGKEIIENMADKAHFAFVHGGLPEKFEVTFDKHMVTQDAVINTAVTHDMIIPPEAPQWLKDHMLNPDREGGQSQGIATYHGPAIMYFHAHMQAFDFEFETFWLNVHIPVNNEEVDLCSAVIIKPKPGTEMPQAFIDMYPEIAHAAFGQDVEIWKDKTYQENPILCDADGPINKLRKWYEQFYTDRIIASSQ